MAKRRAATASSTGTRLAGPKAARVGRSGRVVSKPIATVSPASRRSVDPAGRAYAAILGLSHARTPEIVETIKKGLPFKAFEQFVANTSLSSADAAVLVRIPIRTLTRRKQEGRLHQDESDRLLRASRILGRALELFDGDRQEARAWLARPQRALAGAKPLDVASTEVGALAVERLIDQLEQGVFV
jgi:putative toxin-antitoxin system antitoxin component (TIGR02293 family)